MPIAVRRALVGIVFVLLASWAWFPLFETAPSGEERAAVALARSAASLFDARLAGGHALAALDLRLASVLEPAWLWRLESVALLLLAAWGVGRAARRALLPWSGGELARAAGWSTALLFALHPLSTASLVSLSARPGLLSVAFAALSAWAYLRGRQEREPRMLVLAGACALLAGFSSDIALGLCAWLAGLEFISARRQRKPWTRVRSALAVAAASAATISIDTLARSLAAGRWATPELCAQWIPPSTVAEALRALALALERLGALFVPVHADTAGAWGFALAGCVALVALQPILVASRSAPRLWGRIVAVWACALIAAEIFAHRASVDPRALQHAATLVGSVAVLSAGFGLGSVALSGNRRVVFPSLIALGYAVLSHANGLAYREVGNATDEIWRHISASATGRHVVVIDAPRTLLGLAALEGVEPALPAGVELYSEPEFIRARARGRFDELRRTGRLDLLRARGGLWTTSALPEPTPESGPRTWYRDGRSPELDLDPWSSSALIVRAGSDVDTSKPPVVAWSSADSGAREAGRCTGRWAYLGDAPEAVFDLASSVEWLATARVRQAWSAEGWSLMGQAEFLDRLAPPPVQPRPRASGRLWIFEGLGETPLDAGDARRAWRLTLTALDARAARVLAVARTERGLEVDPADALAELELGPDSLAWTLETTIEGLVIERLTGVGAP
ncbi:MAG: hypothetical protein IT454_01285 [Planctomycetes bacterium]|nr:hypothetical protein [Planctomycetota bacterium]